MRTYKITEIGPLNTKGPNNYTYCLPGDKELFSTASYRVTNSAVYVFTEIPRTPLRNLCGINPRTAECGIVSKTTIARNNAECGITRGINRGISVSGSIVGTCKIGPLNTRGLST